MRHSAQDVLHRLTETRSMPARERPPARRGASSDRSTPLVMGAPPVSLWIAVQILAPPAWSTVGRPQTTTCFVAHRSHPASYDRSEQRSVLEGACWNLVRIATWSEVPDGQPTGASTEVSICRRRRGDAHSVLARSVPAPRSAARRRASPSDDLICGPARLGLSHRVGGLRLQQQTKRSRSSRRW